MTFEIKNEIIPVVILKKKNKNIYMRFSNDTLVVSCNTRISNKEIGNLLEKNRSSLEKMWSKYQKEKAKESSFWYLGKPYKVIFKNNQGEVRIEGSTIYCNSKESLESFWRNECKRVFEMELERILPSFDNVVPFKLKVRKMKSRWGVNNLGSHSITLNSELLKKDLDLIDYVIIHELCHFSHPNHSKNFWDKVSEYYPNYKLARKRLRG